MYAFADRGVGAGGQDFRKTQKLPQKVSDYNKITINHSCVLSSMYIISQCIAHIPVFFPFGKIWKGGIFSGFYGQTWHGNCLTGNVSLFPLKDK
jgi:hypothetical protein